MKHSWIASLVFITAAQEENCTHDTGGTCHLADAASGVTGSLQSAFYYLASTDALDCDSWRGNTTCVDGRCMCAESGVCAVNGQCGGFVGHMTCGGTANGERCQFPFEYLGTQYDDCTDTDNEGTPWCMVAGGLRWGECNCMTEDCEDTPGFIDARNFTCLEWEGFYCPGARMYGYTANQTEDVLAHCPLTCKVCFPPPPQPGANQELVFTVTGFVSFTIDQAVAEDFVNDLAVEEALQTAINGLAGDLAMGVDANVSTGLGVEGLTTFCDASVCDENSVLRIADELPTQCSASACTQNECCTVRPSCTTFRCADASGLLVNKESSPACFSAECQQQECCDFRATCLSFGANNSCPNATHAMIEDLGHYCQGSQCRVDECCLPRGRCGDPAAMAPAPATPASSGPSTGPAATTMFDQNWAGCPVLTHVAKTDTTQFCEGAECTIYECCDMRAICNVTTACNDTQVPKDRNGMSCAGSTCNDDECCDDRDTCESADCDTLDLRETHVFDSVQLCGGKTCTPAECCVVRASCASDACEAGRILKDHIPNRCAGRECLQDECCELVFPDYTRSNCTLDTDNIPDEGTLDVAVAISRCTELSSTCGGITCSVNSHGIATQCSLKVAGSCTSETSTHVSFLPTSCQIAVCDTDTMLLKTHDLPQTCDAGICDASQCCDLRDSCEGFVCPASHISGIVGQLCVGKDCLLSECCDPKDTCEASDCNTATHIPREILPLYCENTQCIQNECCVERDECCENDSFNESCAGNHARHCGDTHIIKPGVMRRFSISAEGRCATDECTLGECCNPRGVCRESNCNPATHVFQVQTALCNGTTCAEAECCARRATCTTDNPCGQTHVMRTTDSLSGPPVEKCEGEECTAEECCEPRDQCSPWTCDTGFTLKADHEPLCDFATCTNQECCDICPFMGLWQSTNVFGGDRLEVSASEHCGSEAEPNARFKVQIVGMSMINFCFTMEASCACKIQLDELTLAQGQMSEGQDAISWDTILNNDLWVTAEQSRRLDAKRYYDVKADGIVVIPHERRLQLQDVRMDYSIQTATASDALTVAGILRELTDGQIQQALHDSLEGTGFQIGSVYQVSEPQTAQVVIEGNSTGITSGAVMPVKSLVWVMVSAIFSAVFWI